MKEKQSLQDALQRAQQLSTEYPNDAYYVLDKKRKRARVYGSKWVAQEMIREGWQMVCCFKNGQKI